MDCHNTGNTSLKHVVHLIMHSRDLGNLEPVILLTVLGANMQLQVTSSESFLVSLLSILLKFWHLQNHLREELNLIMNHFLQLCHTIKGKNWIPMKMHYTNKNSWFQYATEILTENISPPQIGQDINIK